MQIENSEQHRQGGVVTSTDQLPEEMTAKQVCAWLQISLAHLHTLCREGQVPHVRLMRKPGQKGIYRFNKRRMIAWWEGQQQA